jgi:hypothetical protein
MIPKILFQKSKGVQPDYVVQMIKKNIPNDWKYLNFINGDEINFFNENPLEEFPNIVKVFESYPKQQHKADLFRYYFMYINGGVYLDSDAMIYTNITDIIQKYDFVTVNSINPKHIFNGFIYAKPKNEIIYKALKDAYNIEISKLEYFQRLCENLYVIINDPTSTFSNIKIYSECFINNDLSIGCTMDKQNIIIRHYHITKIIPQDIDYDSDFKKYIYLGTSKTDTKIVYLPNNYPFNAAFNLLKTPVKDIFSVTFDKTKYANKLIIKRIDESSLWDYPQCGYITLD